MNFDDIKENLYSKDTKQGYAYLQELEHLSEGSNRFYPFIDEFFKMTFSNQYVIRLRGFRLLCKQAKWDENHEFDDLIDQILCQIEDEKPTAVRQKLAALEEIVNTHVHLCYKIEQAVLKMDCSNYQESMRGLIERDIDHLLEKIRNSK